MKTFKRECRLILRRRRYGMILALLLAPCLLLPSLAAAATEAVKERYSLYCSVCHGDRGDGASHAQQGLIPPPRDFTDAAFARSITRARLLAAITNGVPGTAMIAWQSQLDATEIGELADYILDNFVGAQTPAPVATRRPLANDQTLRIYQESCSVCHGDDGKGAVWGQASLSTAPRNFTTEEAQAELSRDRMLMSVKHGRPGTPMPGFGTQLNDAQIAGVVDYIRARFMGGDAGQAPEAGSASLSDYHVRPFPAGLTGNFERGRSLYFQNCLECHGATGAGDGPRAYFIFPRPRDFHDVATQQTMNRPRLYDGVANGVVGREMPAWRFVLEDQDIADVAEFVYREFITAAAESP